ncbi:MAG: hypothetical protein JWR85_3554 [Marmoricola sp.]|nr:hypothetical protein [Marmoricola sp.]
MNAAPKDAAYWGRVHLEGDANPPLQSIRTPMKPLRYPRSAMRAGARS